MYNIALAIGTLVIAGEFVVIGIGVYLSIKD